MDEKNRQSIPNRACSAYRDTEMQTVSRQTVVLRLYEGAVRYLKRAMEARQSGRADEERNWISRTQTIVRELRANLDPDVSPSMARELSLLYGYLWQRLDENRKEAREEALNLLNDLRKEWETALSRLDSKTSKGG